MHMLSIASRERIIDRFPRACQQPEQPRLIYANKDNRASFCFGNSLNTSSSLTQFPALFSEEFFFELLTFHVRGIANYAKKMGTSN